MMRLAPQAERAHDPLTVAERIRRVRTVADLACRHAAGTLLRLADAPSGMALLRPAQSGQEMPEERLLRPADTAIGDPR